MGAVEHAIRYASGGLSVIPVLPDGSKAAALRWEPFQKRRAGETEIRSWFDGGKELGIAIVCGAVSGNLLVLDFDMPGYFDEWCEAVNSADPELLQELPIVRTPKGYGRHVYVRTPTARPGAKLAKSPASNGRAPWTVAVETRGEGQYVVAPGSPGACHPSGKEYEHVSGPFPEDAPTLPEEAVDLMIRSAKALNRFVEAKAVVGETQRADERVNRPGDDYCRRGDWMKLLEKHGWSFVRDRGPGESYWRRPDKDGKGISASLGHCRNDTSGALLYVFSSNAAPFESDRAYNLFGAYCVAPQTKILTADLRWVEASAVSKGDQLVGFDEVQKVRSRGSCRCLRVSTVEEVQPVRLPSRRIRFTDGRIVIASDDHCWLTKSAGHAVNTRWRPTLELRPGQRVFALTEKPQDVLEDFDSGWLSGIFDGEGWASPKMVGLAQNPGLVMDKARRLLSERGIPFTHRKNRGKKIENVVFNRNRDQLKLLMLVRPERLISKRHWVGRGMRSDWSRDAFVESVEVLGPQDLCAIQTSTRTFIAEGLASHNCLLEFGGDFHAAAVRLAADGYGQSPPGETLEEVRAVIERIRAKILVTGDGVQLLPRKRVDAPLKSDPKFKRTWKRARPELRLEQTRYDTSLLWYARKLSFTLEEMVSLVYDHRIEHQCSPEQALDPVYMAKKIAWVFSAGLDSEEDTLARAEAQQVIDGGEDNVVREIRNRTAIRDFLRVIQRGEDEEMYCIELEGGRVVEIGRVGVFREHQKKFIGQIYKRLRANMEELKGYEWKALHDLFLQRLVVEHNIEEESDVLGNEVVERYLAQANVHVVSSEEERLDALKRREPFVEAGKIFLHFGHLWDWVITVRPRERGWGYHRLRSILRELRFIDQKIAGPYPRVYHSRPVDDFPSREIMERIAQSTPLRRTDPDERKGGSSYDRGSSYE